MYANIQRWRHVRIFEKRHQAVTRQERGKNGGKFLEII